MLGDAGVDNSDVSYTGDVSESSLSLDYYRAKAVEFQRVLNALDAGYLAAVSVIDSDTGDDSLIADMSDAVAEFDAKKTQLRLTAEAINAGAAVINSMGGRFPSLSVPGTLGFLPIAIPAATVVAIGTAAVLATWGTTWLIGLNDRLKTAQLLDAQKTPEQRAAVARAISDTQNAVDLASGSTWSQIGGVVKWAAIAALGYLAFKAFKDYSSR